MYECMFKSGIGKMSVINIAVGDVVSK